MPEMLTDEEIEEVWRESSNGGYCNLVKIDFARAVESAVLKRAVATVVKVFDHAFNMKVKGNLPSLQNVIDALEGRRQP